MKDVDRIRESIREKLSPLGSGTFDVAMILDELELAVYQSDYWKISSLLDANICPNCSAGGEIIHLKKEGFFSHLHKCPRCGYTLIK